jgi:hypothetical protein
MGTGYTRNDTLNNIADGNIINASDLDAEFDAVESAFNESTGHTHDGTAAEGAPVTVLGPVQDFIASATEIKPKTTNTLDIGTVSLQFKDMYLDGTAYIDGLGEDILVATDKKVQFRDTALFINSSADGQLDIDADVELELVAPTVDIDASTAVTIDTATLTVTGSANVVGDLDVDNININGNTIISTDTNGNINLSPNGTGTVVINTDLDVDNININGNTIISTDTNGNIALTPNGTGEVDISKVDIDSGTIDGVTLGTNSAVTEAQVDNININGNTISSTDTNGNLTIDPNGTGNIVLDANVGIGTSSPNKSSSSTALTVNTPSAANYAALELSSGDTLNWHINANNAAVYDVTGGTRPRIFYTNGAERMRIDSSGNVIIGSGGLDVSGIGGTYTALNMRAGAGYPVIYGQTTATTANSGAMSIVGATSGASAGGAAEFLGIIQIAVESDSSTNGAGYINFYTGSGGGGASERLRIDSSGNVGIGVTSMTNKLVLPNAAYFAMQDTSGAESLAIRANASNAMEFLTGGGERMRIDSSGNVGIGSNGPSSSLTVQRASAAVTLGLRHTASGNGYGYVFGTTGTTSNDLTISSEFNGTPTERMRIASGGNVGIGTSSPAYTLQVGEANGQMSLGNAGVSNGASRLKFLCSNAQKNWQISTNDTVSGALEFTQTTAGGGTTFAASPVMIIDNGGNLLVGYTSSNGAYKLQVNSQIFATSATIATSDGNYKENVTPLDGVLSLVLQLNPVQFDWKEHPVHEFDRNQPTIGFIAQEVQQVLAEQPYLNSIVKSNECVLEPEETDDEGNVVKEAVTEPFLGIAEGNMVALLTAAIKEQQATISSLETRIAALEAN